MIFSELRFFVFLALVWAVCWGLRHNRARKLWLLGASYWFYAAWDVRFLGLIALSTLVDHAAARGIDRTEDPRRRRRWLGLSLAVNLGLLGVFKYLGFFVDSAVDLLHTFGFSAHAPTLHIVLPVGISFYTFQTLSYTVDVYRRQLTARRSLLDVALFVAFFPQLVAGPIVRASTFLPQLERPRRLRDVALRPCLVLFWVGFFKKAVVSDTVAELIDGYFAAPATYDALSAWMGVLLYTVQLYCDFSGYSDMAIAAAGLLGYELGRNFDFPYFAPNIAAFWQRWHISLSTWLRDYVYRALPSGSGRSHAAWRILCTMTLCGLWHGAAWHFVVFGAMQAPALVLHRWWEQKVSRHWAPAVRRAMAVPGALLTYWWIGVTVAVFRAASLPEAGVVLQGFVAGSAPGSVRFADRLLWVWAALAVLHWLSYRGWFTALWSRTRGAVFAVAYGVLWGLTLPLVHPHAEPFLYFQF